jgi:diamine N-acetyltransferase
MSRHIRLVDACVADAEVLSAAGERLFVQAYGEYSLPDDLEMHVEEHFGLESVSAELHKPAVNYTIAYDDDAIAGFSKIGRGATPVSIPAAAAIEVQQLYVDADRQRQGVGRTLMDRAAATALQEGQPGLWLSVWKDADWAVRFYEAYGFRRVGTADFRLGSSHYLDHLMWLAFD